MRIGRPSHEVGQKQCPYVYPMPWRGMFAVADRISLCFSASVWHTAPYDDDVSARGGGALRHVEGHLPPARAGIHKTKHGWYAEAAWWERTLAEPGPPLGRPPARARSGRRTRKEATARGHPTPGLGPWRLHASMGASARHETGYIPILGSMRQDIAGMSAFCYSARYVTPYTAAAAHGPRGEREAERAVRGALHRDHRLSAHPRGLQARRPADSARRWRLGRTRGLVGGGIHTAARAPPWPPATRSTLNHIRIRGAGSVTWGFLCLDAHSHFRHKMKYFHHLLVSQRWQTTGSASVASAVSRLAKTRQEKASDSHVT